MRKVFGVLLILVAVAFLYLFASWGAQQTPAQTGPWWPFRSLGLNYPLDVAYLAAAAWGLGLGVYFVLTEGRHNLPSVSTSRFAARYAATQGGSPVGKVFLLNACLLITALFAAYIGAKVTHPGPLVAIFAAVAGLQVAFGLILLVLALFEKPRGAASLILGSAVYLGGTAVAILVIVLGQPQ